MVVVGVIGKVVLIAIASGTIKLLLLGRLIRRLAAAIAIYVATGTVVRLLFLGWRRLGSTTAVAGHGSGGSGGVAAVIRSVGGGRGGGGPTSALLNTVTASADAVSTTGRGRGRGRGRGHC